MHVRTIPECRHTYVAVVWRVNGIPESKRTSEPHQIFDREHCAVSGRIHLPNLAYTAANSVVTRKKMGPNHIGQIKKENRFGILILLLDTVLRLLNVSMRRE